MGNLCIRDLDHLFSSIEHTSYHFTHNLDALWTAVMGPQTLADLVAGIFTGVSSALASVKSGLEAAWDGIKSAGQFIGNAVLAAVTEGLNSLILSSIEAMMHVVAMVLGTNVTRNADLIGMESDSGTVSLWTEISATDISIQTTDTVLFDLDVQKFLLSMLLPIDTLGLYFESEIPELNSDMFNFMIAEIFALMAMLMVAIAVEDYSSSKMSAFVFTIAATIALSITVLLGFPLFPKLSEMVATSKNASLFDNTDQQQLYKEHFQQFLAAWYFILIASLSLLVVSKENPDGWGIKLLDKILGDIPSTLATLSKTSGALSKILIPVLTLALGHTMMVSIIPAFTSYWPLILPLLLVILAVKIDLLYVPVALILLVMALIAMWFSLEV